MVVLPARKKSLGTRIVVDILRLLLFRNQKLNDDETQLAIIAIISSTDKHPPLNHNGSAVPVPVPASPVRSLVLRPSVVTSCSYCLGLVHRTHLIQPRMRTKVREQLECAGENESQSRKI